MESSSTASLCCLDGVLGSVTINSSSHFPVRPNGTHRPGLEQPRTGPHSSLAQAHPQIGLPPRNGSERCFALCDRKARGMPHPLHPHPTSSRGPPLCYLGLQVEARRERALVCQGIPALSPSAALFFVGKRSSTLLGCIEYRDHIRVPLRLPSPVFSWRSVTASRGRMLHPGQRLRSNPSVRKPGPTAQSFFKRK